MIHSSSHYICLDSWDVSYLTLTRNLDEVLMAGVRESGRTRASGSKRRSSWASPRPVPWPRPRRTMALLRRARLRNRERCAGPHGAAPRNVGIQGGTESSHLLCSSGESSHFALKPAVPLSWVERVKPSTSTLIQTRVRVSPDCFPSSRPGRDRERGTAMIYAGRFIPYP